jgi:hypothetical protein
MADHDDTVAAASAPVTLRARRCRMGRRRPEWWPGGWGASGPPGSRAARSLPEAGPVRDRQGRQATVDGMAERNPVVRLEPWTDIDLDLLRLSNTPEMTAHLGGPETEDSRLSRHHRCLAMEAPGVGKDVRGRARRGDRVGTIGYWEDHGKKTPFTRRVGQLRRGSRAGIAAAAAGAVIERARSHARLRYLRLPRRQPSRLERGLL